MVNIQDRYKNLSNKKIKVFYHSDFENGKKIKEILGDMPNYEKYNKEKMKTVASFNPKSMRMDMQACYQNPLLDKDQELYFFKKYNYYKFLAKKTFDSINPEKLSKSKVAKAEELYKLVESLRNEIALSNFRLAFHALRKSLAVLDQVDSSVMLSNAYADIIKAVDYFNFTIGVKFSTYCVWVLKKNASKMFKNIQKDKNLVNYSFVGSDETEECGFDVSDKSAEKKIENHETKDTITTLLHHFEKKFATKDTHRKLFILQNYFGLNDSIPLTLEGISKFLQISKERVRQLKEEAFVNLRCIADDLNLDIEMI